MNHPLSSTTICLSLLIATVAVGTPRVSLTTDFANEIEAKMSAEVNSFNPSDQKVDSHMQQIRKHELATRQKLARFSSGKPEDMRLALSEWNEMLHLTHEMKADMLTLFNTQTNAVKTVMDERLTAAHNTADNVMMVIGAVEDANLSNDRRAAWRGTSQTARQSDRAHVSAANRTLTTAGDYSFADAYLFASHANFDDDVAQADGHETEFTIGTTYDFTDKLYLGISYTRSQFDVGGITNLERNADTLDLSLQYEVTEWLAAALFLGYSHIDVEDSVVVDPLLGPISLGDTFDRWNGGLAVSLSREIGGFDLGLTPAVSSLDANEADRLFNVDQLMLLCMLDVQRAWTDHLSSILYATIFHATGDDLPGDDNYWLVGGECTFAFNDRIAVGIGYETTLEYADYSDHRIFGTLTWTF